MKRNMIIILSVILLLVLAAIVAGILIAVRKRTLYKLKNRTVFTLSTIPSRIHHVRPVIEALLSSSLEPQAVYLNVPVKSIREKTEYVIPKELKDLEQSSNGRFIINRECKDDLGPITKLYPTLLRETDPDTVIIIADDDEMYPSRYHEELIDALVRYPKSAIAYRGFTGFSEKSGEPVWTTKNDTPEVIEGYTGMVFMRSFFSDDFIPPSVDSPCYFTDDIYVSAYLKDKGITRRTIDGIPMGSNKGMGNRMFPMKSRNSIAAMNPLSEKNLYHGDRNLQCYNELFNNHQPS